MIDLAQHEGCRAIFPWKTTFAERQDSSKKYLEIIVKDLVSGGLIAGVGGKGGGYSLRRRPDEHMRLEKSWN